jgi:uncharacterized membrane protein HdeD (DUF308 family)
VTGLICIAAGVAVFAWPNITRDVIRYAIAVWAIAFGLFIAVVAFALPTRGLGTFLLAFCGLVTIGIGVLLILYPSMGVTAALIIVGVYALLMGLLLLAIGIATLAVKRRLKPRAT